MKRLLKKLLDWVQDDCGSAELYQDDSAEGLRLRSDRVNMVVYFGQGGTMLELNTYDRAKEVYNTTMHVIGADKDLGAELNNAILVERLRAGK